MRHHLFLRLTCICMLTSCSANQEQEGVVARVEEAVLTVADLENLLPAELGVGQGPAERARFVEQWVEQQLLYQEALNRRLDQQPRTQQLLEQARRDLLVAALLNAEFEGQDTQVSEASIQQYYAENREDFRRAKPELRALHLLLATENDAAAKRQALRNGASFEELARLHSLDQETKVQGGDLGYFSADDNPALWEACRGLPFKTLSAPIQTQYGYHLIQVLDRQEAGTIKELDQVRPQIVDTLVRQDYRQRLAELLVRLKRSRKWAIDDRRLGASQAR
ncbi:MAG: peptidyl-prolyl cis-trans isomerase [Candidatus Latescibacteria bacterium]|nr:peptidyl-prolyl cis-trans isomerase [Candidatus Latescibacterota bacterium]